MTSILITGGTGYFGRAFIERLLQQSTCERICVYSRDEYKQAQLAIELNDPRLRWFIGDVRDRERLTRAMTGVGVVIHAAALKRVEVGEYNPMEMVKTNVLGTMNVIEAAFDAPMHAELVPRRVVYLSTDKAMHPVNAYGASKLMGEKMMLAANNMRQKTGPYTGPMFAVTRYGNVAGSTGSVIPFWRALKADGTTTAPVTDPRCTRFWMTKAQAVDVVMHTIETMDGNPSGVVVPILPAYELGDLAEAMGMKVETLGLRPGEKLHEAMDIEATSDRARRMTVEEIREALEHV